MTKENILTNVKKALDNLKHGYDFDAIQLLNLLTSELVSDLRTETNKKNGAGKVEKILKDIFTEAAKVNNGYKMMQYSTILNDKQYALDGHRLIELETPIDAPVWERDNPDADLQKYYEVSRMMPETPDNQVVIPDLLALKQFNKTFSKKIKTVVILETENGNKLAINSRYLENALINFTDPKIYTFSNNSWKSGIIVSGKEGRLFILPINLNSYHINEMEPGFYNLDARSYWELETETEKNADNVA